MTGADRLVPCGNCGQVRKAIVYWPVGPVCRSCYIRARANPAQCQACGLVRVLIAESPAAAGEHVQLAVCGPCAGSRHSYLCTTCGGGDEPYKNGVCVRCAVHEKLTQAFTGPDGQGRSSRPGHRRYDPQPPASLGPAVVV